MKDVLNAPVFILSSERSGTNLLRVLLDNHSCLYGPRAPQLLKIFKDVFPHYDLENRNSRTELLRDIYSIVSHPFVEWKIDQGKFERGSQEATSFLDFWELVYGLELGRTKARDIVCKENNLFDWAFELYNRFPKARFIYLYRDPRDVCASWMKVHNGFKNVSQAAQNWNKEQLTCLKAIRNYGLPVVELSYEELTANTPEVMTRVLSHLNLEIEPACFSNNTEKGKEVVWNEYWKNLGKGVMKNNSKKYQQELSSDEILLIETRCAEAMALLGYHRETKGKWEAPRQSYIQMKFASFAHQLTKPKYRNKRVEKKDDRQNEFVKSIRKIQMKRWEF